MGVLRILSLYFCPFFLNIMLFSIKKSLMSEGFQISYLKQLDILSDAGF